MSTQKTRLISGHAPGLGQAITQTFEAAGNSAVGVFRSGVWATDLRDPHAMAA